MSVSSERQFLEHQKRIAEGFFEPEFLAYLQQKRAELERLVGQPPTAAAGRRIPAVASSLRTLLLAEGIRSLFEGQPGGFAKLQEAQTFEYWEARVYEHAFQRDQTPDRFRRGLQVVSFGDCLLALHVGASDTADAIMRRLVSESFDSSCNDWAASTEAITFQAHLYEEVTRQKLEINWSKLPQLQGYRTLLNPELKGADLSRALDWACVQHMEQAQSQEPTGKFMPFAATALCKWPIAASVRPRRAATRPR